MKCFTLKMKKKNCDKHSDVHLDHFLLKNILNLTITVLQNIFSITKMGNIQKKQKFTSEDLVFLKSHTGHNKKDLEKWCKKFKKDCPNGLTSPELFEGVCNMFFPYINAKAFCSYIFNTFDTEDKGVISLKELMLVIGNMEYDTRMAGTTSDEKLKWAIIAHDMWIVMERLNKICSAQ